MTNHLFRKCIVSREWWKISEKERWNLMYGAQNETYIEGWEEKI